MRKLSSYFYLAAAALLLTPPAFATTSKSGLEATVSNAMTELSVKTALLEKIGWDMLTVDVEAYGSHVVLMGTADDRANQEMAKEVALAVDGVEKVTNKLALEPKKTKAPVGDTVVNAELEVKDAVLESRVKTQLIRELGLNAFDIDVEATDGKVSLRGKLTDPKQTKLAIQTAENCEGVERVVDLLSVEEAS